MDENEEILKIWEKTIDVQMHFNDIEMRIRNLFITVMLALTGAIGWVLEKGYSIKVFHNIEINFSIILLLSGLIACYLFYLIDRHWYHQLLVGSVNQALALDRDYGDKIPALGLTLKISGASPIIGFKHTFLGKLSRYFRIIKVDDNTYSGDDLRSSGKIALFYYIPIRLIQLFIISAVLFGGISIEQKSITSFLIKSSKLICS